MSKRSLPRLMLLGLLSLLLPACLGPVRPSSPGPPFASIHVVNHGWHSGIVFRRADIPADLWPESADFPGADFLEVGWGDWDYYQAPDPGLWLTLKAGLWPTRSVLQVVGIRGAIGARFSGFEVRRIALSAAAYNALLVFLHDSFDRNGQARVPPLAPGPLAGSFYYPARGRFHLFNTCNTWTARALAAAGLPQGALRPITADQLMDAIGP